MSGTEHNVTFFKHALVDAVMSVASNVLPSNTVFHISFGTEKHEQSE